MSSLIVSVTKQYLKTVSKRKKKRAQAHLKVINEMYFQILYLIYMYKQDLALNNLQ